MLVLGEEFQAASVSATNPIVVAGPVQIEGDAPNRFFLAEVRNTGANPLTLTAEVSVTGVTWAQALNQAGGLAGVVGLSEQCEQGFNFIVPGNCTWWRIRATGITTLGIKIKSLQSRAPTSP